MKTMITRTMNQVGRFTLSVIMSFAIFSACEQNEFGGKDFGPRNKGDKNPVKAISNDNSSDNLSQYHNNALDKLAKINDFPNNVSGNEAYQTINSYLKDSIGYNHFLDYSSTKSLYQNMVTNVATDKQEYVDLGTDYFVDYLTDEISLSNETNGYINDLKTHYGNFRSVSDLKNDLSSLEKTISKDATLEDYEKEMLTKMTFVARGSLKYWNNARNNNTNDWHGPFTSNLNNGDQEDFMLNLSIESTCAYIKVFHEEYNAGYTAVNANSAALNQAAVQSTGPVIVATTNW